MEQRADEYLDQYAMNLANFLKEAVTISPPEGQEFHEEGQQATPVPPTPGEPATPARKI